ncbi:MAG TPA: phosphoenolpyruvate carboxykinase (ATP) [Myxococcota bacterium]|nr:phosphoenolpyruvate carboxykinase (ATP) [Myxococcota bacterium]
MHESEQKAKKFVNLSSAVLVEHAIEGKEGVLSDTGALITNTKKYTGRSPKDKFTVIDRQTEAKVWFSDINKKMSPEHADTLFTRVSQYLTEHPHYVIDCTVGASADYSLKLRVTTERAWHALFARNMFLKGLEGAHKQAPDFAIYHAPGFLAVPERDHTNSEAAVVIDYTNRRIVICGTEYAGEIKKSVFTVMNFLLPNAGVLSMHCSANKNAKGDVAIFFGLSGTGKTTLSADSTRSLIGDDEHGWDENGVFNFEGGCYAKVINLSKKDEPEIYHASKQFTAILENVIYDDVTRELKLDDNRLTENTRSSYDISFIANACLTGKGGHPNHIVMLTCDAFGVLPPIAKLSPEAAAYYFVNGYTAKVAGTERGIKAPEAVFSACFGAPFMAHFPVVYARLLEKRIKEHGVQCWLVNTGWSGGPYGVGSRMKISWTRTMLQAALDGALSQAEYVTHPIFRLSMPKAVTGVPSEILNPRDAWKNKVEYDAAALKLARLFNENYEPYSELLAKEIGLSGPVMPKLGE